MSLDNRSNFSQIIRNEAIRLGFEFVGFAKAEKMDEESQKLDTWLKKGYHGKMGYMENHFEKRTDPTKLVEGAKTVISLTYNYYTEAQQPDDAPKIAKYAYGEDYHHVVKDKLKELLTFINDSIGEVHGRCFVDSAPVMERDWGKRAGVGWIGKNTLLIQPKRGSFFFLAELILDIELLYDEPMKDYCGTCTKCIDACPTDAILGDGLILDASKCISYLTIELKDAIPTEFQGKMEGWAFGCDICQDVCPWNRFSKSHDEPLFRPNPILLEMEKSQWLEITEDVFKSLFKKSAVKRTKYDGLVRNIEFLKSK
jgi:epoxyqueuosine reductase